MYLPTYVWSNAQHKAVNILERKVLESYCIPVHTAYSVGLYALGGKEVEKGVKGGGGVERAGDETDVIVQTSFHARAISMFLF